MEIRGADSFSVPQNLPKGSHVVPFPAFHFHRRIALADSGDGERGEGRAVGIVAFCITFASTLCRACWIF